MISLNRWKLSQISTHKWFYWAKELENAFRQGFGIYFAGCRGPILAVAWMARSPALFFFFEKRLLELRFRIIGFAHLFLYFDDPSHDEAVDVWWCAVGFMDSPTECPRTFDMKSKKTFIIFWKIGQLHSSTCSTQDSHCDCTVDILRRVCLLRIAANSDLPTSVAKDTKESADGRVHSRCLAFVRVIDELENMMPEFLHSLLSKIFLLSGSRNTPELRKEWMSLRTASWNQGHLLFSNHWDLQKNGFKNS